MSRTVQEPVQTVMERLMCDCGGEMKQVPMPKYVRGRGRDMPLLVRKGPRTYEHVCSDCGIKERVTRIYPRIVYVGVEE